MIRQVSRTLHTHFSFLYFFYTFVLLLPLIPSLSPTTFAYKHKQVALSISNSHKSA